MLQIGKILASQRSVLPSESTLDCTQRQSTNLNNNLQPRACETDARFYNKTLFFQNQVPLPVRWLFPSLLPFSWASTLQSFLLPPSSPFPGGTVVMKICFTVSFFTCSFPRLTHCASVQMNMSAQAMSLPPLRKSSWAQSRPRGYFTTAVHTQNTIIDNFTSNFNDCIWYWKTNKKKNVPVFFFLHLFINPYIMQTFFF